MRITTGFLLTILGISLSTGQTYLIIPGGDGGFQLGPTFEANGWAVNNDEFNYWVVGTAVNGAAGLYTSGNNQAAYISNSGGSSNSYALDVSAVSSFSREVVFPSGYTQIVLKFSYRVEGSNAGDNLRVSLQPAGFEQAFRMEGPYFKEAAIILPSSLAGTTQQLIFRWTNDGDGVGTQPPAALDNISLTVAPGIISNGTGGGPWSSGSTWEGAAVPTALDNVTILPGDLVTVDLDAEANSINVSGGLVFGSASNRALSVRKDVVVDQNGAITVETGTASHKLIVGGDLANNGTMDLSTNAGAANVDIEFNGTDTQIFFGQGLTDITSMTVNTLTSTATVIIKPDNFTVQDQSTNTPGFLIPQRGTVRLSGNAPLESFVFTTAGPIVNTSSAVWFDNENLVMNPQAGGLTVQGTLRVSGGVVNIGEDQDDCVILAPGSTFITEGGAINVSAAIGVASPSHSVKFLQTGGAITVQRFGNSSTTFAGFDLGTSSLTSATTTAGTITIEQANTALTGPGDFRVPFVFNITGGELHLGNATTTAESVFRIRGVIPNLIIDETYNHTVQLFQSASFAFSTTIPPGVTLDLNGTGLSLRGDLDITAGATLMGSVTSSSLTFGGSDPQVFNLDGVLADGYLRSLVIFNSSGASPAVSINDDLSISNSLFLTNGSVGGSGTLTLGNSAASSTMTMTRVNGSMLTQPLFGPDVTYNANYNISVAQTVTGPELPSIVTGTLTINDIAGVYLAVTTTATTLSLTNGTLNTDDSRVIIVAGTSPSNIVSSGTSFVSGPVVITLPTNLDGLADYTVPVGTTMKRPVTLVAPKTDPTPNTRVFLRASDYFGGTPGNGISALPDGLRWFVTALTGQGGTVTETRIALAEGGYGEGNEVAKSETIDGTYNSIGGTVLGATITSDVFNSFSYFAVGLTDNTKSGVYTVGSAGNYATITAAVADLDTSALSGPVVLSLTDPSYSASETFPIVIRQIAGANATNTLTIRPASGISPTISGAPFISSIFKLAGADYVMIDGSNNGTDSRDMTINNTYGGGGYGIWLASQGTGLGARKNTFKNLIISAGSDQSSSNSFTGGILGSNESEFPTITTDGADQDSNLIHNNLITKARYGIFLRGASGNPNDGNVISSNVVGPDAFGSLEIGKSGIVVQHQNAIQVIDNEVKFVGVLGPQSVPEVASEDKVGIGIGTDTWPTFSSTTITNAIVTGNVIHDIIEEKTQSAVGILIGASGSPSNNLIANNVIYNVRANATSDNQGVGLGISNANGDKIVFNSIRMEGDIDPGTSTTATGSNVGMRITGGSNPTVKNNIISVDLTSNVDTVKQYAIVAPSFYNWGTGGLNYNDYYVNASNTQMRLGGIGSVGIAITGYADLPAWKTLFSGTQDANSKSFAPDFASATDLHLNVGAVDARYVGTPIPMVTKDIDGDSRNAVVPYIGSDEVPAYSLPQIFATVEDGSVAWGDFDNDGDLDVLLTGRGEGDTHLSKIYRNDNATFVDIAASIAQVSQSSVSWGDFDRDGDLDIVLSGYTGSANITHVYRNDAGTFVDIAAGFPGLIDGSVSWGDFDNDGDLDLLLSGNTGNGFITKIYKNTDGVFVEHTTDITGAYGSSTSAAWGDFDNDGDMDIVVSGFVGPDAITKIYTNDAGVFTDITAGLTGVASSSVAWGDYDSDGDLDVAIAGYTGTVRVTKIYRQDSGGMFVDLNAGLLGTELGVVAWGDVDNDGDLDLLVTGTPLTTKIYRNDGSDTFTETTGPPGLNNSTADLGDFDNDGDLDFFIAGNAGGSTAVSTIHAGSPSSQNTPPAAPSGISSEVLKDEATLLWNRAQDTETSANGLTYNIRVGTTPGGIQTVSPMSDEVTGKRRLPRFGNMWLDTTWTIKNLEPGVYYWSVQSIDNNFVGSSFAPEQTFTIAPPAATPPAAPTGLVITDSSSRTITIKWLKNTEPDFLRYRIYRGTVPNPTTQVDSTTGGIGDTSKTLTSLTNGTRYYLRVTAVDSAGSESGYSNEVNAVPADRIEPTAPQDLVVTDSSSTQIRIAWAKNTDADFFKYMIYRGTASAPTTLVDSSTASIADTGKLFTGLVNGTRYYFRVTAVDSARNESAYSNEVNAAPDVASGISDLLNQIPEQFSLSQNYPNPFNPSTVIRYGIPERSSVKVELFDVLGRRIAVLVDLEQEARYYEVLWNANVPSGIYFYRINAVAVANREKVFQEVRRMVLIR